MSISLTFPFTDSADYTFDPTLIEVTGGKAQLKLADNPGQVFTQDFASSTGFTFDAAKTEFVGGVMRQIDKVPAGGIFGATYTNNINGNWGGGTLTGTAVGGASVLGGKLDLAHGDLRYITYNIVGNMSLLVQTGCIRLRYKPNYSGTPATTQSIIWGGNGPTVAWNEFGIQHMAGTGGLQVRLFTSNGVTIATADLGAWNPTAGTEYEIEMNFDATAGATRLFVNGTQFGATLPGTGLRNTNGAVVYIGTNFNVAPSNTSNFTLDGLICFSAVQHTANYTPGYTVYEAKYIADTITVPEMEYTGAGTLVLVTGFSTTETDSPRYTLQIGRSGNYLYWNGAAWAISDNTYTQANDKATFLAHIATLPVTGQKYGQFRIYFTDINTLSSIDILAITLTAQIYSVANPTIECISSWINEGLDGFTETKTVTGTDNVKYVLKKGTSWYWWNGTAWVVSAETYAQANTAAEIETNKATFTTEIVTSKFKAFLHSAAGTTTPQLNALVIQYNYSGEAADSIHKTIVWGYREAGDTTPIVFVPSFDNVKYKLHTRLSKKNMTYVVTDFRTNGYWEVEMIDTENMSGTQYYNVDLGNGIKKSIQIAAVATLALEDAL